MQKQVKEVLYFGQNRELLISPNSKYATKQILHLSSDVISHFLSYFGGLCIPPNYPQQMAPLNSLFTELCNYLQYINTHGTYSEYAGWIKTEKESVCFPQIKKMCCPVDLPLLTLAVPCFTIQSGRFRQLRKCAVDKVVRVKYVFNSKAHTDNK